MRYAGFVVYFAITIYVFFLVCSDAVFNETSTKQMSIRLGLAIFWPLAILSSKGREVLFNNARGL